MSLKHISTVLLFTVLVVCTNAFKLNKGIDESSMFVGDQISSIESTYSAAPKYLGQIGGVAFDANNDLVVFDRADRPWAWNSYNDGNKFNTQVYPNPIQTNVIHHISADFEPIGSWGRNLFYLPHGLTVDYEGNIWTTDVGLHQVFKFTPDNLKSPALTLGTRFEPGSGARHFCKPTGIAVNSKTGDIFVSDGYCNSRVAQFDKSGKFIKEFTDGNSELQIAHSVALLEDQNLVCTVSRQDGRIVCFDINGGNVKHRIRDDLMKTVFAIRYDKVHNVLHAVTGANNPIESYGLTFDVSPSNFGTRITAWQPDRHSMGEAHDLAISNDGSQIMVGQLNGELDQFEIELN